MTYLFLKSEMQRILEEGMLVFGKYSSRVRRLVCVHVCERCFICRKDHTKVPEWKLLFHICEKETPVDVDILASTHLHLL